MKKMIFISLASLVILLLIFALRPMTVTRENCKLVTGTVTDITEGGIKDAVFKLSGHESIYYINRGFEDRFTLPELIEKFKGKEVSISFVDHWTPLDPNERSRHIAELTFNQEIIYSELKR